MTRSCECQSCGNIISVKDEKCPYCGTLNTRKFTNTNTNANSSSNTSSNDNSFVDKMNFISDKDKQQLKKVNWVVFIILLIVFWPAAIVYLFVKLSSA